MENKELVTKATEYIKNAAIKNDISPEDIAYHAGFSIDYFNRMFLTHTGFTLMEYVRFVRLHKAAMKLRHSDDSILEIALACGYESHETFCRAFKKQYQKTPSEYRESMKSKIMVYAENEYHATLGARLTHEFPFFKVADTDEAIECLLAKDAVRYGYDAICFRMDGGVALYEGASPANGFLWFENWSDDGVYECNIYSDDYREIAKYCKLLPSDRFRIRLHTLDEGKTVKEKLGAQGVAVKDVSITPRRVYRGAPYSLRAPEGIEIRSIDKTNLDEFLMLEKSLGYPEPRIASDKRAILATLEAREKGEKNIYEMFIFGIYRDGKLMGYTAGGLQSTHGFVLNNCVYTTLPAAEQSEELYRYAFGYVTNAALAAGALPFDDIQYEGAPEEGKSGSCDSGIFGYEKVNNVCALKR